MEQTCKCKITPILILHLKFNLNLNHDSYVSKFDLFQIKIIIKQVKGNCEKLAILEQEGNKKILTHPSIHLCTK